MKDRVTREKEDVMFFRMMLLMSLVVHALLCIFFVKIEIPILIYFNIGSVIMYLFMACFIGHVYHIERYLVVLFLEVVIHVLLCNLYLGWGYGFSLYGLMIIPITYYISYTNPQIKHDILGSNLLSVAALAVIVISCVETGSYNKFNGFATQEVMYIFCINLSLRVFATVAYSAYFVMGLKQTTRELEERNEELDFMAHYDALTNMRNRQNMAEVFQKYEESEKKYCVVLGDLDDFKEKNDVYGHVCGDELLVHLSYLIRQAVRNRGEVCRWGGDEILLLLKMDHKAGYQLVENIRQQIKDFSLEHEGKVMQITMTWGFVFCDEAENMEKLISIADARLYEGKKKGKNQIIKS